MCGIFGWAGKDPKKFDKSKFDILGMYNIERGKHSCGVSADGDIYIGTDTNKVYHDFLANSGYNEPQNFPFVVGHTRHATGGAHNVDNAHPFGFGQVGDSYEFIGVHNGKLHNHTELAEKYKIDKKETITKDGVTTFREKIDSEVLLEAIYSSKEFKVLEEYRGAAALVFCNINEPNVVYFYHGKSKKYYADTEPEEERPLWFWQRNKNDLYVSSIAKSLIAIGGTEANVHAFDYNTVYKVTDGDVDSAVKFKINRANQQQSEYLPANYGRETHSRGNRPRNQHNCGYRQSTKRENDTRVIPINEHLVRQGDKSSDNIDNIYNDKPIKEMNQFKGGVFLNKLRYYRNGHLIDGIFTYIPKFGFYYLGEKYKEAADRFYGCINKYFDPEQKDFIRLITSYTKDERKRLYIPFNMDNTNETDFPQLFYFYDGVRVKTRSDYEACLRNNPKFDWEALSICSAHPVCDIKANYKKGDQQNILWDGKPATDTIAPLGGGKVYEIVDGNCKSITKQTEVDAESLTKISDAVALITAHEKDVLKDEITSKELEEIESPQKKINFDEDLLEKDLDHFFKEPLRMMPGYIKRLEEYKDCTRAAKAKEMLEIFVESASKLMTVDIND